MISCTGDCEFLSSDSPMVERSLPESSSPQVPANRESAGDSVKHAARQHVSSFVGALSAGAERRERKLSELAARRRAGEISPLNFDAGFLRQLNELNRPLTRADMRHSTGEQALVLTSAQLQEFGVLHFLHITGEEMHIEPESIDPDDVLILYPNEVGDEESAP